MRRQRQRKESRPLVIGVTGNFGSGKTTVARYLRAHGAEVVDADRLAHQVILPGKKAYRRLVSIFGRKIIKRDGRIDRKVLAKIVFSGRQYSKRLNRIVHPEVIKLIYARIRQSRARFIIIDAPLLIEAGLRNSVDRLIVVKSLPSVRVKRLMQNRSLSRQEILKRDRHQLPLSIKEVMADFIIDNSRSLNYTKKQLERIRRVLWKN